MVLGGSVLQEPEKAGTSLPQGDPFSPMAMCAVMLAAFLHISHVEPTAKLKLFVDDRTWETRTAAMCVRVGEVWKEWSTAFGLMENECKQQWMHRTPQGREKLRRAGVEPRFVVDTAAVLGAAIKGGATR